MSTNKELEGKKTEKDLKRERGERFYKARKKTGLTQEEFSEKLSLSIPAVVNYESGKSIPMYNNLKKIMDMSGMSADYLLYGIETPLEKEVSDAIQKCPALLRKHLKYTLLFMVNEFNY